MCSGNHRNHLHRIRLNDQAKAAEPWRSGRDKSLTGSTCITDLNKNGSYSRVKHTTFALFLFKSAITFDPAQLLSLPLENVQNPSYHWFGCVLNWLEKRCYMNLSLVRADQLKKQKENKWAKKARKAAGELRMRKVEGVKWGKTMRARGPSPSLAFAMRRFTLVRQNHNQTGFTSNWLRSHRCPDPLTYDGRV